MARKQKIKDAISDCALSHITETTTETTQLVLKLLHLPVLQYNREYTVGFAAATDASGDKCTVTLKHVHITCSQLQSDHQCEHTKSVSFTSCMSPNQHCQLIEGKYIHIMYYCNNKIQHSSAATLMALD